MGDRETRSSSRSGPSRGSSRDPSRDRSRSVDRRSFNAALDACENPELKNICNLMFEEIKSFFLVKVRDISNSINSSMDKLQLRQTAIETKFQEIEANYQVLTSSLTTLSANFEKNVTALQEIDGFMKQNFVTMEQQFESIRNSHVQISNKVTTSLDQFLSLQEQSRSDDRAFYEAQLAQLQSIPSPSGKNKKRRTGKTKNSSTANISETNISDPPHYDEQFPALPPNANPALDTSVSANNPVLPSTSQVNIANHNDANHLPSSFSVDMNSTNPLIYDKEQNVPEDIDVDPTDISDNNDDDDDENSFQTVRAHSNRHRFKPLNITNTTVEGNSLIRQPNTMPPNDGSTPLKAQPPLCVTHSVKDWAVLHAKISKVIKHKYTSHHVRGGYNKITTYSEADFHAVSKLLQEDTSIKFHTYQVRSQKLLKYVLRTVPYNWSTEAIDGLLKDQGLNALKVIRLEKNKKVGNEVTRVPMPMLLIVMPNNQESKRIMDLKQLGPIIIDKVEPFRQGITPIQCYKCQQFHHVAAGCFKDPKCNRCGDSHQTRECQQTDENFAPKCANCSGPHHASYKGCPHYAKIVAARRNARTIPGVSYASATRPITQKTQPAQNSTSTSTPITMDCPEWKSLVANVNNISTLLQHVAKPK